jgi:hypothetical protein
MQSKTDVRPALEPQKPENFHCDERMVIQELVDTARGVALILYSLGQYYDNEIGLFIGLAKVLRQAADPVDVYYFECGGDIAHTDHVPVADLIYVLEKKLYNLRAKAAA